MLSDTGITEFTTISLSDSPPRAFDRRTGHRYMSVLQAGKIITRSVQELCLIRNISSTGVMAEIFAPLEIDTPVQIEFKAGSSVEGTVRWLEDGRAGIEFAEPIDVHAVLAPHTGRLAPRAPRLSIDSMATVIIGENNQKLQVFDISQGGVKVAAGAGLEPGLDVVVEIEGLPVRASVVRWVSRNHAGISFNRVMPLDQVAYWAAQQDLPNSGLKLVDDRPAVTH